MRLIDAEALRREIDYCDFDSQTDKLTICQQINEAPAVDAELVTRCKDCKKSGQTESGKRYCSEPMGAFYGCIPVEDDFFCSGGVRKEAQT